MLTEATLLSELSLTFIITFPLRTEDSSQTIWESYYQNYSFCYTLLYRLSNTRYHTKNNELLPLLFGFFFLYLDGLLNLTSHPIKERDL
jgi:hypothetical protein